MELATSERMSLPRHAAGYALLIVVATGALLAICWAGERLAHREPIAAASATVAKTDTAAAPARPVVGWPTPLAQLLVTLVAVIVVGRGLGALLQRVGQPAVIGEIAAGIVLGPSMLGRVWPAATDMLLSPAIVPALAAVAQLGVVLYMFVVGLELSGTALARRGQTAIAVSHASIIAPFLLAALVALLIYPEFAGPGISFTAFALFLGVAMSVTAFPVLARILKDQKLDSTPLGLMALAAAAVDDATAWCLLALAVSVAQAEPSRAAVTVALTVVFVLIMLLVVRPAFRRTIVRTPEQALTARGMGAISIGLLVSALATEAIGLHAVFGAFLFGAILPHDSRLSRDLVLRIEDLAAVILLPAYFALTGMRTEIALVHTPEQWLICGLLLVVAVVGKVGGTLLAARVTGASWRSAAALGALMNTRGLMGLIVLNIGLDLGIVSPTLFAMMVLIALATTLMAAPALAALRIGGNQLGEG